MSQPVGRIETGSGEVKLLSVTRFRDVDREETIGLDTD